MPPTFDQSPLCTDPYFRLLSCLEAGEQANTQSLIGITVAIGGNILISLALNCQKLAHKRLDLEKQRRREPSAARHPGVTGADSDRMSLTDGEEPVPDESRLLIGDRRDSHGSYTTPHKVPRPKVAIPRDVESPRRRSALASSPIIGETLDDDVRAVAIDVTGGQGDQILQVKLGDEESIDEGSIEHSETDYLRSKLWCVYYPGM